MKKIALLAPLALCIAFVPGFASAKETKLKVTAEKLRSACGAAGGEFLGVTGTGTYGCDNTENGGSIILCTRSANCLAEDGQRRPTRSSVGAVKRAAPVVGALARR